MITSNIVTIDHDAEFMPVVDMFFVCGYLMLFSFKLAMHKKH